MRIYSALDDIFAGQNGELPEGTKFNHIEMKNAHQIEAVHPSGKKMGWLTWWKKAGDHQRNEDSPSDNGRHQAGEVDSIDVLPQYQRRGVATAMWNYAHSQSNINPKPIHSTELTDEGRPWSTSVGRPEDEIDQALRGEW